MAEQSLDLSRFYEHIQREGKLRNNEQAKRWSGGTLNTLGLSLDRKTKRALAKHLPEELRNELTSVFWLLHFRNPNQPREDFLERAARRSGNSDPEFAYYPILAVFSGIKSFIDFDLNGQVSRSLSPDMRELWLKADKLPVDLLAA